MKKIIITLIAILILLLLSSCKLPSDETQRDSVEDSCSDEVIVDNGTVDDGTQTIPQAEYSYYKVYKLKKRDLIDWYATTGSGYGLDILSDYDELCELVTTSARTDIDKEIFENNIVLYARFHGNFLNNKGIVVGFREFKASNGMNYITCDTIKDYKMPDEDNVDTELKAQTDENYLILIPKSEMTFVNVNSGLNIRFHTPASYNAQSKLCQGQLGESERLLLFNSDSSVNEFLAENKIDYKYHNSGSANLIALHYEPIVYQNEMAVSYNKYKVKDSSLELCLTTFYNGEKGQETESSRISIISIPYGKIENINVTVSKREVENHISKVENPRFKDYLTCLGTAYGVNCNPININKEADGNYGFIATNLAELQYYLEGVQGVEFGINESVFYENYVLVIYSIYALADSYDITGFHSLSINNGEIHLCSDIKGITEESSPDGEAKSISYILIEKEKLSGIKAKGEASLNLEVKGISYYEYLGSVTTYEPISQAFFRNYEELCYMFPNYLNVFPEIEEEHFVDHYVVAVRSNILNNDIRYNIGFHDFYIEDNKACIIWDIGILTNDEILYDGMSYNYIFVRVPISEFPLNFNFSNSLRTHIIYVQQKCVEKIEQDA